jgi:hypothetical protein
MHPNGVATIETKFTALTGALAAITNGPWRIAGKAADFPRRTQPLNQARTGAQILKHLAQVAHVAGVQLGFVSHAVTPSGGGLDVGSQQCGDTQVRAISGGPPKGAATLPQWEARLEAAYAAF